MTILTLTLTLTLRLALTLDLVRDLLGVFIRPGR